MVNENMASRDKREGDFRGIGWKRRGGEEEEGGGGTDKERGNEEERAEVDRLLYPALWPKGDQSPHGENTRRHQRFEFWAWHVASVWRQ